MANISVKQIREINAKCGNGFKLDVQHYVFWGEKELHQYIPKDEGHAYAIRIDYRQDRDTGLQVPTISLEIAEDKGNVYITHGWAKRYPVGEPCKRRMFNKLIEISQKIDVQYYINLAFD